MRLPWAKPKKVLDLEAEAHELQRGIEATQPILDEAVKRTNDTYIAVEAETRQAAALIRNLKKGWNGRC